MTEVFADRFNGVETEISSKASIQFSLLLMGLWDFQRRQNLTSLCVPFSQRWRGRFTRSNLCRMRSVELFMSWLNSMAVRRKATTRNRTRMLLQLPFGKGIFPPVLSFNTTVA